MHHQKVSYHVQEKITGGWFNYAPHDHKATAQKQYDTLQAKYHAPRKFRLVRKTVLTEVIG